MTTKEQRQDEELARRKHILAGQDYGFQPGTTVQLTAIQRETYTLVKRSAHIGTTVSELARVMKVNRSVIRCRFRALEKRSLVFHMAGPANRIIWRVTELKPQ